jgi:hypothetical protein
MRAKLAGNFTVLAVLTLNFGMSLSLMLVFLCFEYDLAADFALIVHAGTADIVHAELAHFDHALARGALLLLFLLFNHI